MTVSITAAEVERTANPLNHLGAQLRMDGDIYVYMTPEVAAQWLPVLEAIAGSGGLAHAFDDGFTACANQHAMQRRDPTHPITRINPYKTEETN
jgi:hypothetical protein